MCVCVCVCVVLCVYSICTPTKEHNQIILMHLQMPTYDTMIKPQGVILINILSTGHMLLHAHNSVLPDPTMTVDNVTQILNKIRGDKWEGVMGKGGLDIPRPLLREIQLGEILH